MNSMSSALKFFLERSKYLVLITSAATLIAAAVTFVWATVSIIANAGRLLVGLLNDGAVHSADTGVGIVSALDSVLMAIILYIFSIALYELFIGKLEVPEWLAVKNLDGLKEKLASVVILILAVTFLKHLVEWKDALDTFLFGLAIAAVLIALVFYMKHKKGE